MKTESLSRSRSEARAAKSILRYGLPDRNTTLPTAPETFRAQNQSFIIPTHARKKPESQLSSTDIPTPEFKFLKRLRSIARSLGTSAVFRQIHGGQPQIVFQIPLPAKPIDVFSVCAEQTKSLYEIFDVESASAFPQSSIRTFLFRDDAGYYLSSFAFYDLNVVQEIFCNV